MILRCLEDLINKIMYKKNVIKRNSGMAVMMTLLFFIIISSTLIVAIVVPTSNQIRSAREAFKSRQSYIAADSATDDALYRLSKGWTLPSSFVLAFSDNIVSSAIVDVTPEGYTQIFSTGDAGIPIRFSKGVFSKGTGVSLNYSAQIGDGGIKLKSGTINGSVYSNGNIEMISPEAVITGSATVANESDPVLDQTNYSESTTSVDFGKTSALQDIAQGFQVNTTIGISFVRVYLKKTGGVGNITLRIVSNSGSNPGGTTIASKTISSSAVSTVFDYVPVPLSSPVTLTPGTQYWLVLDYGSNNNNKYYTTKVSDSTYSNGVAKRGSWNSSTGGTWNAVTPAGGDILFDMYAGGEINKITGEDQNNRIKIGTGSTGNAWAYEVSNANVAGNMYCQSNSYTYNLSNGSSKSCINQTSAPILDYPISDANVTEWKQVVIDATNITGGWTYSGNLTVNYLGTTTTSLRKIVGNLTIDGGGDAVFSDLYVTGNLVVESGATLNVNNLKVDGNLTISSGSATMGYTKVGGQTVIHAPTYIKNTLWSVGYIKVEGGGKLNLDPSLGSGDGMFITDGRIEVTSGGDFDGSGTTGSFLLGISTIECPGNCSGSSEAVKLEGGAGAVAIFAPYGKVFVSGGSSIKQVTAKELYIEGGSSITYDPDLANIDLGGGDSSSWVVESWGEVSE